MVSRETGEVRSGEPLPSVGRDALAELSRRRPRLPRDRLPGFTDLPRRVNAHEARGHALLELLEMELKLFFHANHLLSFRDRALES
jgi:hypothetical protein